ncbi:MAG: hypothetical protein QMD11_09225 [Smithella sp.]|nr:hypothetical protein [Smithella sp.]
MKIKMMKSDEKTMRRMKRIFLSLIITIPFILLGSGLSLAAGPDEFGAGAATVTFDKFNSPEGQFSVSIPSGWQRIESYPYKIDDTVNGIMIEGPQNMAGAPVTIAVLHYAGKGWIKGADHFIRLILAKPTRLDYEKETTFSDTLIAGKKGREFTFEKFHLVILPFLQPPMEEGVVYEIAPPTRRVKMIARYIVLSDNPGFYALWLEAPEDIYHQYSAVFDVVVKSFAFERK